MTSGRVRVREDVYSCMVQRVSGLPLLQVSRIATGFRVVPRDQRAGMFLRTSSDRSPIPLNRNVVTGCGVPEERLPLPSAVRIVSMLSRYAAPVRRGWRPVPPEVLQNDLTEYIGARKADMIPIIHVQMVRRGHHLPAHSTSMQSSAPRRRYLSASACLQRRSELLVRVPVFGSRHIHANARTILEYIRGQWA